MDTQNEVVDTQNSESTATPHETQGMTATSNGMPESTQSTNEAQPSKATEEKLWTIKVQGQEVQLKESELIKYAQLGKHGQRAMEKAADLEKRYKSTYDQLVAAAMRDLERGEYNLHEVLTGKRHPQAAGAARTDATAQSTQEIDPREQKLREYEDKIQRLEQRFEQEDIERERKAVEGEISDAVKKYPEIDSPYLQSFVKQEYRRCLRAGLDHSIDDVAFLVAQDVKAQEAKKRQGLEQKLETNKQKAPFIAPTASAKEKKAGGIEYAKKLAGLS